MQRNTKTEHATSPEMILGQKLTLNATETKSHLENLMLSYNADIPIKHLELHLDLI